MKSIFISFFLFFLACGQMFAQYDFTIYGISDGLPDKFCRGMATDSLGNLWVGTQGGVAKWDGSSLTAFPLDDGVEFPFVKTVETAPDGNIWIGYLSIGEETGLSVIDPDGNLVLHEDEALRGMPGTWVNDIAFGPDGLVYAATWDGMAIYDGVDWSPISPAANNFGAAPVWDIEFAPDGSMWAGTIFGLAHLKTDGEWENFYTLNSALIDDNASSLAFGPQGRLWIGTGNGLSVFDGQNFENHELDEGLPNGTIQDISFDETGRAWIATEDGFSIFDGEDFQNFKTVDEPFVENLISDILIHPSIGTWMTTRDGLVKVTDAMTPVFETSPAWAAEVELFPLPALDHVNIRWKAPLAGEIKSVQLFSMEGRPVRQVHFGPFDTEACIDLSTLPGGQYLLRFKTSKGSFSKSMIRL